MEYNKISKLYIIVGVLCIISLLLIVFVLATQWQKDSTTVPQTNYNPEIASVSEQHIVNIVGRIQDLDPINNIILVHDLATTAFFTVEVTPGTVMLVNDRNIAFDSLVKGKYVTVVAQSVSQTPSVTAMRINMSDTDPTLPPPPVKF